MGCALLVDAKLFTKRRERGLWSLRIHASLCKLKKL
jgi:hypothetical protein